MDEKVSPSTRIATVVGALLLVGVALAVVVKVTKLDDWLIRRLYPTSAQITVISRTSGETVPLVTVTLDHMVVTTNSTGQATLTNLRSGLFTVHLVAPRFETEDQTITLTQGNNTLLLNLRPLQAETLFNTPVGRVDVTVLDSSGKRSIHTVNYDGTDNKPLLTRQGETEDFSPILSPDNKMVAMLSTRDRRNSITSAQFEPSLYLVDSSGNNLVQISNAYSISNVTWSSNSRWLAWTSKVNPQAPNFNLFYYDLQTKKVAQLSTNDSTYIFHFANAGNLIAWVQAPLAGKSADNPGLFVRDLTATDNKNLTADVPTEFAFSIDNTDIMYRTQNGGQTTDQSIHLSDGFTQTVTATDATYAPKIVAPNGQQVAYILNQNGDSDIFISDGTDANQQQVTHLGSVTGQLHYDASGEFITFTSQHGSENAVYIAQIASGQAQKVIDYSP